MAIQRPPATGRWLYTLVQAIGLVIALVLTVAVEPAGAAIPEPDSVLYGTVGDGGIGTVVEARLGNEILASYTVGSLPEALGPISLRGWFEDEDTIRLDAAHVHRFNRDIASYVGLFALAILWLPYTRSRRGIRRHG